MLLYRDLFYEMQIQYLEENRNMLKKVKCLIHGEYVFCNPFEDLVYLLEAVIELLELESNDFTWSSWANASVAVSEIRMLIKRTNRKIMDNKTLGVIFAATGPLQEVSFGSGWGDAFVKIADIYDRIEEKIVKT